MREPVFKRPNSPFWWCYVRNPDGGRGRRVSTGCRDKTAALQKWRALERLSVTGADKTKATSLADALDRRIEERGSAGRAAGTIEMLTQKSRHLNRLLGADTPLRLITAAAIDRYVSARLSEGASRSTIHKELSTLRGALRLAKRRGEYAHDLAAVMPEFAAVYKPKTRALSFAEIKALLAALSPKRAALVAFLLATGATYPSEVKNLRKGDVDTRGWFVLLRGTKRETRYRKIPIVSFARPWLLMAVEYVPFDRWGNIRRDLHHACDSIGIERCSPTDLRRTLATLLRAHGAPPHLLANLLGHADSRMVERVYGRLSPEQLGTLLGEHTGYTGTKNTAKQRRKA